MFYLWIISIIAAVIIAINKNRNAAGWFLLSLILGPVAAILILLLPKVERKQAEISGRSDSSLNSVKAELENLKSEFPILSDKLNNLERKISELEAKGAESADSESHLPEEESAAVPSPVRQEPQPVVSTSEKTEGRSIHKSDIEINLGKFWLNKIGMIVFSLGIAFLISYTLTRIGPATKIFLGYLTATALFILGIKLERIRKFINYGRVLLGGSWAITYFTTYAMYHFEASRIINSQFLDLFLLAVVAFGIIVHSLHYRSETLTAVTLFIGFFTSVLGNVGHFTLISAALLAVTALVMVYKMQWVKFIFLGIILTYLTHLVWVTKQIYFSLIPAGSLNVKNVCFLFNAGFLLIYWVLFTAAIHFVKNNKDRNLDKKLAAANFLNFILFFFMAYPKFYFFYPAYKFNAVLCFGLAYMVLAAIMDLTKKNKLFVSNTIIAVSLLTLSIPLKFLPYHTTIIWFIELPFLLFVGFIFERKVYRNLGFALSVLLFLKLIFSGWALSEKIQVFSFTISWKAFLSFAGFVSTAICFSLYRFLPIRKDNFDSERRRQNFYSGFSVIYLTMYIYETIKAPWLTFGISLESLLILIFGVLLLDKYLRLYAMPVLALAGMRFCLYYYRYHNVSGLQQLFIVYGPVAFALTEYFIYRMINKKSLVSKTERWLAKFLFFFASSLLIFAIVVHIQQIWITLSISITAILALLWGIKISDKHIRVYSLWVLFFAAVRFLFVDTYYSLNEAFKWFLIFAKLACGYAVYFIYRALDKKSRVDESKRFIVNPLFYISSFLAVFSVFKYIKDIWVAVSLGIFGVSLFAAGFLIKEKIFRNGGFIVFGITLTRVIFVDMSNLPIIYKIISFMLLGVLFLGVSFIYTNTEEKK